MAAPASHCDGALRKEALTRTIRNGKSEFREAIGNRPNAPKMDHNPSCLLSVTNAFGEAQALCTVDLVRSLVHHGFIVSDCEG